MTSPITVSYDERLIKPRKTPAELTMESRLACRPLTEDELRDRAQKHGLYYTPPKVVKAG